jgi:hypothetical protein
MVLPGQYAIRLTANGQTRTQSFQVVDDPRIGATPAELAASYDLATRTVATLNAIGDNVKRIESLQQQLTARADQSKEAPYAKRVASAASSLKGRLEAIRAELADVHSERDQITLHYPVKLYNQLLNVNRMAQSFERGPTEQSVSVYRELAGKVDALIGRERTLESGELAAFNQLMRELNVPAVGVEQAKPIS